VRGSNRSFKLLGPSAMPLGQEKEWEPPVAGQEGWGSSSGLEGWAGHTQILTHNHSQRRCT